MSRRSQLLWSAFLHWSYFPYEGSSRLLTIHLPRNGYATLLRPYMRQLSVTSDEECSTTETVLGTRSAAYRLRNRE